MSRVLGISWATARVTVALLVVSMLAPAVGAVMDHHFPERQPGHGHLGRPVTHAHGYGRDHSHYDGHRDAASGETVAVYDYKAGSPTSSGVVADDKALLAFLLFQPELLLLLPQMSPSRAAQNYVTPPGKPPPRV